MMMRHQTVLIGLVASSLVGRSSAFSTGPIGASPTPKIRVHGTPARRPSSARSVSLSGGAPEGAPSAPFPPPHVSIDTSAYRDEEYVLTEWLNGLDGVQRSPPQWVGGDILRLSPSRAVQDHLSSLFDLAPVLFPTESDRCRFDWDWRYGLLRAVPSDDLRAVLSDGISNTHPLRLQLVACPPGCDFSLHAHPAVEYGVPLVGSIYERRASDVRLEGGSMRRREERGGVGGGRGRSSGPTPEELRAVGDDLSRRAVFEDRGEGGAFVDRECGRGRILVNEVGSVHQSYTGEGGGCLLFVLGSNLHARFLPGNFRQRTGIDSLRGIDHLVDGTSPQ